MSSYFSIVLIYLLKVRNLLIDPNCVWKIFLYKKFHEKFGTEICTCRYSETIPAEYLGGLRSEIKFSNISKFLKFYILHIFLQILIIYTQSEYETYICRSCIHISINIEKAQKSLKTNTGLRYNQLFRFNTDGSINPLTPKAPRFFLYVRGFFYAYMWPNEH